MDGRFFQYLVRIALVTISVASRPLTNAGVLFRDGTRAHFGHSIRIAPRLPAVAERIAHLGRGPKLDVLPDVFIFGRQE